MAILNALRKFEVFETLRTAIVTRGPSTKNDQTLSLFSLLRSGIGKREASDPRDLVYGILGLVESKDLIEPDYELSIAQVFTRAAFHIVRERQDLFLLVFNDIGHNKKLELPSWVPDWTSCGTFCPSPYEYDLFASARNRPCHGRIYENLELEIRTVQVDWVEKTASIRTVAWDHPRKLVSLIKEWRRLAGLEHQPPSQENLMDHEEAFWKVVFADTIEEYEDGHVHGVKRRFEPRDLVRILGWWKWLQAEAENFVGSEWNDLCTKFHEKGYHTITDRFWSATENRKLIITSAGRMGTGLAGFFEFPNVTIGDEVHVAYGSKLPMILRLLRQEERTDSTERFEFVGTCFVHGIMDGETLLDDETGDKTILLC